MNSACVRALKQPWQIRGRTGHTLVEVVVACVVFAVGVLSLQGAMLRVLIQGRDARVQELAVEVAAAQLERLGHSSCSGDIAGSASVRGIDVSWSADPGPGRHARPVQQRLTFTRSSGKRSETFTGAIRCR